MSGFYAEDLAYVHHVGFGAFARDVGEQILGILRRSGMERGLVVDLGCGSGIWPRCLLQAGFQVLGIDISPDMLALARQQAPRAEFEQGSVYDCALPPCEVVTALGEVLCYGSGGMPDDDGLRKFFRQVARQVAPGGLLIFDVMVTHGEQSLDYRSWQKGSDWAVLVDSREQPEAQRLIREITVFRQVNGHYRRSEERHPIRVFDPDFLRRLLAECGFRVSVSDRYGEYQLAGRRLAFVAEKARLSRNSFHSALHQAPGAENR